MPAFNYGQSSSVKAPSGRQDKVKTVIDLKGIDLTTPNDLLEAGRSPFAKNFRLYAQQADSRRVAVSSRKGPGGYINPINESKVNSNESTVLEHVKTGYIEGLRAQPFQASGSGRMTKVEIGVRTGNGYGPLMVRVYDSGSNGLPYNKLGETSLATIDDGWATGRFVDMPLLTLGQVYWIVLEVQDDGGGFYEVEATAEIDASFESNSGLPQLAEQDYSLRYRVFTAEDRTDKGGYRFNREAGNNVTLAAYGSTMYVSEGFTNSFVPLITELSPSASEYSFTNGDGKVFWANGYDEMTAWDGTYEANNPNLVANGGFDVGTTGWAVTDAATITRVTGDFHTGPASLNVTKASAVRGARTTTPLIKNNRYKITYWAKSASGSVYTYANGPNSNITSTVMDNTWKKIEMYYTPTANVTSIDFKSDTDNFFIDDVSIVRTGIEYIKHVNLPIVSQISFHKNMMFAVPVGEKNAVIYSEQPGLPEFASDGVTPTPVNERWYYAWFSVAKEYVPKPKNGSPIVWIGSFQDNLIVMTEDKKYVISGSDRGNFFLRESTGSKGAVSMRSVSMDENKIYFVGKDNLYEFDGSKDTAIGGRILPLIDACPRVYEITPVIWRNQVRFYMASQTSACNDIALIYERELSEFALDTQVYVNRAIHYNDSSDDNQLAEFSSLAATVFNAEQGYDSLGEPIDFEYRLAYDALGNPAMRKRIKRFFPILQGADSTFKLMTAMDKDFQDSPKMKEVNLIVNGALFGDGSEFGDGTLFGGDKSFKRHRQSHSGYASYWQMRLIRRAVRNRVAFIGVQYTYKTKRM